MALPEHKYYTLKQAAKKAGCEIEDLIHFAAIGVLQLSVKIPSEGFVEVGEKGEETPVLIRPEYVIDDGKFTGDDSILDESIICSYESEYLNVVERYSFSNKTMSLLRIGGLVSLYYFDIDESEAELCNGGEGLYVNQFTIPRVDSETHSPHYSVHGFYLSDVIEVNLCDLLITSFEMQLLLAGGKYLDDGDYQSDDTVARKRENFSKHKSSLINSLIELAFVEDGGIEKLSYESLAMLIQEKLLAANIPCDDVSPYNLRNWIGRHKARSS